MVAYMRSQLCYWLSLSNNICCCGSSSILPELFMNFGRSKFCFWTGCTMIWTRQFMRNPAEWLYPKPTFLRVQICYTEVHKLNEGLCLIPWRCALWAGTSSFLCGLLFRWMKIAYHGYIVASHDLCCFCRAVFMCKLCLSCHNELIPIINEKIKAIVTHVFAGKSCKESFCSCFCHLSSAKHAFDKTARRSNDEVWVEKIIDVRMIVSVAS